MEEKYKTNFEEINQYITRKTKQNDYIFCYFRNSLFYFLTDRKNPSFYINFLSDYIDENEQQKVISDLNKKKVNYIITHWEAIDWPNKLINQYIEKEFWIVKKVGEFSIWERQIPSHKGK